MREIKSDTYPKLRDKVDELSAQLEKLHRKHLMCRAGCDLCCMDYSIFPVEFYFIRDQLTGRGFKPELPVNSGENTCVFLKDHRCTIYNERPIICRTHGLPLLYANDDGEWELSACELNFTEFDLEDFNGENTFPQDRYNSRLFMLNKNFIRNFKEKKYNEFDLIPLKELPGQLNHDR
jgi:Fe-S-cluster containining protein